MRITRDFRAQQLDAITQRGNGGQWIHRDTEDFEQAFMREYTTLLMHNHGHWIFEALRDMQKSRGVSL